MGGHSWVMDRPQQMIERYVAWAREIRDVYQSLSAEEDYRYMFDPYWVRAEPYRVFVKAGQTADVTLHVRNFLSRSQKHRIEVETPPGVTVEPALLESSVGPAVQWRVPPEGEHDARLEAGRAHRRFRRDARRQALRPVVRHGCLRGALTVTRVQKVGNQIDQELPVGLGLSLIAQCPPG